MTEKHYIVAAARAVDNIQVTYDEAMELVEAGVCRQTNWDIGVEYGSDGPRYIVTEHIADGYDTYARPVSVACLDYLRRAK